MEITLFSGSGFSWRVQLACALKGIDYQTRYLTAVSDLKSPEMLALNPRAKVPIVRDGDFVLAESLAILAYLERKHASPPLFGIAPEETGVIWKTILDFDLYVSSEWVRAIIAPAFTGRAEEQAELVRSGLARAADELTALEQRIGERDWFVGATVTAADVAIYPIIEGLLRACAKPVMAGFDTPLPFADRYPQLEAWRGRIRALPGYDSTYPVYWRELDARPAATA